MEYKEILEKAINKYGVQAQTIVAIEEISELTKCLTKSLRYGYFLDFPNFIEEIADVEIMLSQIKLMYLKPNQLSLIEKAKQIKINRLKERLENND